MKLDTTTIILIAVGVYLLTRKGEKTGPNTQAKQPGAAVAGPFKFDRWRNDVFDTPGVAGLPGRATSFFNTPQYQHGWGEVWQATVSPTPWNGRDEMYFNPLMRTIRTV